MTDLEDPPRWTEPGSSVPQRLRELFDRARQDAGSDAQLARLAERLGPLLGPPGALTIAAATKAGMAPGAKLGLTALGVIAIGGGFLLFGAPRIQEAAVIPFVSTTQIVKAASSKPELARELAKPVASLEDSEEAGAATASPSVVPRQKQVVPGEPSEAELLEQARDSLTVSPSRALARASEHARRFPRGVLVQEREVIAIQALRQLGRTAEADRRARAFSKAFPGSAFERRLEPGP